MSNKKQTFTKPEVDVIKFENDDVVTASTITGGGQSTTGGTQAGSGPSLGGFGKP